MADQPITTSIDDLVKYLNEHGETDSVTLADALKVRENIINTWAEVLEKAKIVKINYKLGRMFVSPVIANSEGVAVAKKTVEMKKSVAESELLSQISFINQVNVKLEEFKKYVKGADAAFASKAGEVKEMLDQIDKLNNRVDASYKTLKEKKDFIDNLSNKLEKDVEQLEVKGRAAEARSVREGDSKRIIEDIRAKLEDTDNKLKILNQNFNSIMEDNRKGFSELLTGIRTESKSLRDILGQQEKDMHDYTAAIETYRRDSESTNRKIAKERTMMLDDIVKSSDEVRRTYNTVESRVAAIRKTLAEMRKEFGGFAELTDKLNNVKNNIDLITKEKEDLQRELNEMLDQLKALNTLQDSMVAQKSMEMHKMDERVQETQKKVDDLSRHAEQIKNSVDDMAK